MFHPGLSATSSFVDPARIRFVSGTILILSLLLLIVSFGTAREGEKTAFGPPLGADFAGFYTGGYILNHYPPTRLYETDFQNEIHHQLHPHLGEEERLPFVHPPFVAWVFRPLALLPYSWAFACWLIISLTLYLSGLLLTLRGIPSLTPADRLTALLLALSFEPFVMECWLGGQLSAVGFFCLALGVALDRQGQSLRAGLVLGLCFYKPPLLVIVLPALLAARRFRALTGVALMGLALVALTLSAVGWDGCQAFVQTLSGFTRATTQNSGLVLRTWKYIDLNNFARLLLGVTPGQRLLFASLALPLLGWLLIIAWRTKAGDRRQSSLFWAAVILATPVINLYVGIYDGILAVLGALVLVDALGLSKTEMPPGLRYGLVVLWVVPWFTQPLARAGHMQLFTLVLLGFICYSLLATTRRAVGVSPLILSPDQESAG